MKVFYHATHKWNKVISDCYKTDQSLLDNYHILAPTTLNEAISHTCKTFLDISNRALFEMFECTLDDKFIGYFGVEHISLSGGKIQMLNGFFLLPEYRTKEVKEAFLKCISKKITDGKGFITGIYSKNERAIRFFESMGAEIISKEKVFIDINNEPTEVEYVIIVKK